MRTVQLSTGLEEGDTLTLEVCSKYMHSLGAVVTSHRVDATGMVTVELEESKDDECVCASLGSDTTKKVFWVHEGSGVQKINLLQRVYPRNVLPVFLNSEDEVIGVNAEYVMGKVFCGDPVTCEEEQRLLKRHCDWQETNDDEPMCRVDKLLEERYENG